MPFRSQSISPVKSFCKLAGSCSLWSVALICLLSANASAQHPGIIPIVDENFRDHPPFPPQILLPGTDSQVSGKGWIAASKVGVEVWFHVIDPAHQNQQTGSDIWNGDSLQIYLDARGDGAEGNLPTREWIGSDDLSLCMALTESGPSAWLHHWGRNIDLGLGGIGGAAPAPSELAYAVVREGDATHYRATIPWAILQTHPLSSAAIGFAVSINNGSGPERKESKFGYVAGGLFRPGLFARMPIVGRDRSPPQSLDTGVNPHTPINSPAVRRVTDTVSTLEAAPLEMRKNWRAIQGQHPLTEIEKDIPQLAQIELRNTYENKAIGDRLRIVAWNIQFATRPEESIKLLQEHPALKDADAILLSEVDIGTGRSHNRNFTRELADALKMNYAYGIEFLELPGGLSEFDTGVADTHGYTGNAILSKAPLENVRMVRFPSLYNLWYNERIQRLGGRMALFADIRTGDATVTLVSTHFESQQVSFREPSDIKSLQMQMVIEELAAQPPHQPIIFGGDLNATPNHPLFTLIPDANFTLETSNNMALGTGQRTNEGLNRLTDYRIDYICLRNLRPVQSDLSPGTWLSAWPSEADGLPLSDHAIVSVDALLGTGN